MENHNYMKSMFGGAILQVATTIGRAVRTTLQRCPDEE